MPDLTTNAVLDRQTASDTAADLDAVFARFRAAHPEVAEAMALMQMSFPDYIAALEALQQEPLLIADNNTAR